MPTASENPEGTKGLLLTLDRGIRVLEEVARYQGDATAKSIAMAVSVNLGTCYQLLRTLEFHGYVHRFPGGRFGLGSRVGFLIDHYEVHTEPPAEFVEILHELHQALEETVYVSLRRGRKIEIGAQLEGTKALRVGNLSVGYGDYPHVRATTKVFLAYADSTIAEQFLGTETLEALTPNTITDRDLLDAELRMTRLRGYGIDNEEFSLGVCCIGSVIVDTKGEPIGAYGTSFPSTRLSTDREAIASFVVKAGEQASRVVGYRGLYPPKD